MTIRHLRIFIAVAQTGQMGAAAKKLYISQPTVSKVIAEIEENYGIRLFERLSKKLYITDAGKQLLGYAQHITTLFDEMERELHGTSVTLPLRVGATNTVGRCFLPGIVRQFEEENPNIFTEVLVDNTQGVVEKLLSSQLDLAVVEGKVSSGELIVRPVATDELVLICGDGHPLCKRERISLTDLSGQPFVLREKGSGTRERFEQRLTQAGVSILPKWTCRSSDSILAAVSQGQGLSVISRLAVEQTGAYKNIHILNLEGESFHRVFHLVYHKNKFFSEAIGKFVEILQRGGSSLDPIGQGNERACTPPDSPL